ncbi:hypothetical protein Patl_2441 [Paraglaciecola sp. T6c]|uniref:hypothetical protein n=1 Tax=Pseudoalteromonas atlantica (strain T6c / ATCC BAA-1087) TaxID=3042615 RepID=UPI00005C6C20|nr:hypothetical protein [Paraglaciecola sp. T6c]ABG40957.1 hypothetical protein Patl_2441 [Paraglaciecola sp. T6c]
MFKLVTSVKQLFKSSSFNRRRERRKQLSKASERIKEKEKALLESVTLRLGKDPSAPVSEALRQLDNLSTVLELQRSIKMGAYGMVVIVTIGILAIAAFIPGLPTPGHIKVQSTSVEITLSKDFDWSGTLRTMDKNPILLSQFTQIDSPQIPELTQPLDSDVLQITSLSTASLESLFMPAGTKLWIEWDEQERVLIFIMTPSSPAVSDELVVRAEFKHAGETRFVMADKAPLVRRPLTCPMEDKCILPRRTLVSAPLGQTPRIRLHTRDLVSLAGLEASQFSFSKYTLEDSKRNGGRCTVTSGEYQLRGSHAASNLHKGECIHVKSIEGAMGIEMSMQESVTDPHRLQIWYQGMVKSMRVGSQAFTQEQTPKLLAYLIGIPAVSIIGSILGVLLATGFAVIRVKQ